MSAIESILSFISTIGTFISNMVASLVQGVLILANSVQIPLYASQWVSPFIGSCITIIGAIAIIKLLIGWGNS